MRHVHYSESGACNRITADTAGTKQFLYTDPVVRVYHALFIFVNVYIHWLYSLDRLTFGDKIIYIDTCTVNCSLRFKLANSGKLIILSCE